MARSKYLAPLTHEVRMKRCIGSIAAGLIAAAVLVGGVAAPAPAQKGTLNVITAGDQNMVDYVKDFLAPMFEQANPGVTVKAAGTGPGDAGSQKISEKLAAQQAALNERMGGLSPEKLPLAEGQDLLRRLADLVAKAKSPVAPGGDREKKEAAASDDPRDRCRSDGAV